PKLLNVEGRSPSSSGFAEVRLLGLMGAHLNKAKLFEADLYEANLIGLNKWRTEDIADRLISTLMGQFHTHHERNRIGSGHRIATREEHFLAYWVPRRWPLPTHPRATVQSPASVPKPDAGPFDSKTAPPNESPVKIA